MEKRNYSQPLTKVMSMAVNGAVCEPPLEGSTTQGKVKDTPLF